MKRNAHREALPPIAEVAADGAPAKPPYNIVIVYDEFAAGRHAVETCHRLIAEFRDGFTVRVKVWSFAVLRNSAVNLTAATDATKAQMVMVAASCEELPSAVRKWLETWLVWNGGKRGMLVALLQSNRAKSGASPAETYLRGAAVSGGMEFLLEKVSHAEQSGMFCPH